MDDVTNTDAVNEPVEQPAGQATDSITLQELQLLAQIVDLATQRGAFRGNELTTVGGVYDRLTTFLAGVAAAQQAQASAEAQGDNTPDENTPEEE